MNVKLRMYIVGILCVVCFITSAILAICDITGWGWFLFCGVLLTTQFPSNYECAEIEELEKETDEDED